MWRNWIYLTYIRRIRGYPKICHRAPSLRLYCNAYMNGDFSSRDIEEDCCRDINFMFLLEDTPVPDHAAFARFHTLHFTLCSKKILAAVQSSFTVSVRFREKIFLSMEQRSKSTRINTLLSGKGNNKEHGKTSGACGLCRVLRRNVWP